MPAATLTVGNAEITAILAHRLVMEAITALAKKRA